METDNKFTKHSTYYFIEFLILALGFILIINLSFDVTLQFIILIFTLFSYIILGFIHHHTNHTFSSKIVIEYILISSLILAGFMFLNIGRIP